ncbi:MAG: UDP-N-acetylmuramate dehydrogenase [Zetaproteobacteria bacterium]|nr:MAG: UDP-N-acetylmuramate dehydrogenase [Zetaproteobacteria bacterium]
MSWWRDLAQWGAVVEMAPLAPRTTLGVGGVARWLFRPLRREGLIEALRLVPPGIRILVLGRGSNVLPPDGVLEALVVDMGALHGIELEGTALIAEAGARMGRVAAYACRMGLSGLEFMATIPGTIGGGVAMNAGAYGAEVADVCAAVEVVRPGEDAKWHPKEALGFGYRRARLPEGAIVLRARFALKPDDPKAIAARMQQMREKRARTQPLERPNCGSVFKNPEGDHAARLIEAAGLKGLRVGGAMISEKHANFIVNLGWAKAADVRALIERAREEVYRRFGVRLEPEVRIWEAEP